MIGRSGDCAVRVDGALAASSLEEEQPEAVIDSTAMAQLSRVF
jgi:hypothetical protein